MDKMTSKHPKCVIIDPLTCIIKLALINYYPLGTKLSINNNTINFCSGGYLQGIYRFIYGDGREDLHNLYNPICKAIKWYYTENDDNITYLFDLARRGLVQLKSTYPSNNTIQYTLDHYIDIIKTKKILESDAMNTNIHNFMYESLWTELDKKIIYNVFYEIVNKKNEIEKNNLIDMVNNMINVKNRILTEYLNNTTTIL